MSEHRPKRKAAVAAMSSIRKINKYENDEKTEATSMENNDDAETSSSGSILFCDDTLAFPQELFVEHILSWLSKPELVHHGSLVSNVWKQTCQHPLLWTELAAEIWKKFPSRNDKPPSKRIFPSMRQFYLFLRRPQFSKLKKLVPPDLVRTFHGNLFDKLAQSCPRLEELDLSGSTSNRYHCLVPYAGELPRLPDLFPHLKRLRVCMRSVSRADLAEFARRMGDRLVELTVVVHAEGNDLYDETLEMIAQHCLNLEIFEYNFMAGVSPSHGRLSERGPIALLKKCQKLKVLRITVPLDVCPRVNKFFVETGYESSRGLKLFLKFPVNDEFDSDDEGD